MKNRDRAAPVTIKTCPFCASAASLAEAGSPPRFGVRCGGCQVRVSEIYQSREEALAAWGQRRGTASYFGGRATKGLTTRRKNAACRKNLRRAREKKRLNALWRKILTNIEIARSYRQEQANWATHQAMKSRERLRVLMDSLRDNVECAELVRQIEESFGPRLLRTPYPGQQRVPP